MKHRRPLNKHHIIPRSRGGSDDPRNIIHIDRRAHAILHEVFGNRTPDEYLVCFTSVESTNLYLAKILHAIKRHT